MAMPTNASLSFAPSSTAVSPLARRWSEAGLALPQSKLKAPGAVALSKISPVSMVSPTVEDAARFGFKHRVSLAGGEGRVWEGEWDLDGDSVGDE